MNTNEWNQYIYDLYQKSQEQEKRLKALETKVERLENEGNGKGKHSIEKIEYHFDQLKIENLDGTLHIGLSPSDLANLEDFNFPTKKPPIYAKPMKQSLVDELSVYLHETGPQLIRDLSNEHNNPIDEGFQSILITDIEKQLPKRIAFYEQDARKNNQTEDKMQNYIFEQIKNEIYHSLLHYMKENNQKGAE